jgi:hypothetical protein
MTLEHHDFNVRRAASAFNSRGYVNAPGTMIDGMTENAVPSSTSNRVLGLIAAKVIG